MKSMATHLGSKTGASPAPEEEVEERITLRLPKRLLDAIKERAELRGVSYQRVILEALRRTVTQQK